MYYLSLFHCNNGYMNAPHCYVIRTLPVLLMYLLSNIKPKIITENLVLYFEATNTVHYIHISYCFIQNLMRNSIS
jgi:hypothetical protein